MLKIHRRGKTGCRSLDFNVNISHKFQFALIPFPGYLTGSVPMLTSILQQNSVSIGKYLRATNRSCPRRNQILGEHFCRFAIKLTLYTNACAEHQQNDTHRLHSQFHEAISNLELRTPAKCFELEPIRLPSTGKLLTASINASLNQWKLKASDEIRVNFRLSCSFFI